MLSGAVASARSVGLGAQLLVARLRQVRVHRFQAEAVPRTELCPDRCADRREGAERREVERDLLALDRRSRVPGAAGENLRLEDAVRRQVGIPVEEPLATRGEPARASV